MRYSKRIHNADSRLTKLNKELHNEFVANEKAERLEYRLGYYEKTSFTNRSDIFHHRSKRFIERNVIDNRDSGNQFITVNTFSHPTRKSQYLFSLMEFYIDLDIYNSDYYLKKYNELYPSENEYRVNHRLLKKLIKSICEREGVPYPSKIMYSGNGYYLFWKIRPQNIRDDEGRLYAGAPKQMSKLYKAIQKRLVKAFLKMGADTSAVDVSRVLRAEGSSNTKTGEFVETIYETGKRFDIKEFASQVLPYTPSEVEQYKRDLKSKPKGKFNQTYAQWLLKYLNELVELGKIRQGNTNNFMYLYFYALKLNELPEEEGLVLHSTFKHQLDDYEIRNCIKSANKIKQSISKSWIKDFLRLDRERKRSTKKEVKYAKMIHKIYNEQLKHYSSRQLASFLNIGKDTANKIKRKYEQVYYVFEQFIQQEVAEYAPKLKNSEDNATFEWIYKYLSLISSIDDYKKWQTEFATE